MKGKLTAITAGTILTITGMALLAGTGTFAEPVFAQVYGSPGPVYGSPGPVYGSPSKCKNVKFRDKRSGSTYVKRICQKRK